MKTHTEMRIKAQTDCREEDIRILYDDSALILIHKPSGMLSVPGRKVKDSAEIRVQTQFPRARLVHRLDQPTSGLLVFAQGYENQVALQRQFSERKVRKRYVAIVEGRPDEDEGTINLPLICDWPNRPRQKVCFETGKPSITKYKVCSYDEACNTSRVSLFPVTGRSHQLRVHMQQLGHAILGDPFYAPDSARSMSDRLLLHAEFLAFHHPETGKPFEMYFGAPF